MNTIKLARTVWLCVVLASGAVVAQTKTTLGKGATAKPEAATRRSSIVAAESSFTFLVAKTGLIRGIAHDHNIAVKSFSGQVTISFNDPASGAVELEADVKSLTWLDQVSEKVRAEITKDMNTSVLDSEKFPNLALRAAGLADCKLNGNSANFTLNGDLTLHNVRKRIAIPVTLTVTDKNARAVGQYDLRQTDFGIKPYSARMGTIKVKNEVIVKFNIVAR